MKMSCGTDIIEISRIKEAIEEHGAGFIDRVFTEKEKEYCESKKSQKYQHYAGRFAAKEAAFKAISNALDNKYDLSWTDLQILNDNNGRPYIEFLNNIDNCKNIDISISHCKEYAVAMAVFEII